MGDQMDEALREVCDWDNMDVEIPLTQSAAEIRLMVFDRQDS
jgi:hypothetical protein